MDSLIIVGTIDTVLDEVEYIPERFGRIYKAIYKGKRVIVKLATMNFDALPATIIECIPPEDKIKRKIMKLYKEFEVTFRLKKQKFIISPLLFCSNNQSLENSDYAFIVYPDINLSDAYTKIDSLSYENRLYVAKNICKILTKFKCLNVMHLDIKMENVMIADNLDTYLIDWEANHIFYEDVISLWDLRKADSTFHILPPEYFSREKMFYDVECILVWFLGVFIFEFVLLGTWHGFRKIYEDCRKVYSSPDFTIIDVITRRIKRDFRTHERRVNRDDDEEVLTFVKNCLCYYPEQRPTLAQCVKTLKTIYDKIPSSKRRVSFL